MIYKHKSTRGYVLQAAAIAHLGGTEQNEVSHSTPKETTLVLFSVPL